MNIDQRRRVMKAFINSHFGYCPLVWMFCSRSCDNRINRIHEKALRIVYNDRQSSFDELLEKDNSVSIHTRNLQLLATEIYKIKHNLSPPLVRNLFQIVSSQYNLRRNTIFESHNVRTKKYGIQTLSYLGPKIWEQVPSDVKLSSSLNIFKEKIKKMEA